MAALPGGLPRRIKPGLPRRQPGFTLIELLITVSIIAILSGLSIVGYNAFNDRQLLLQTAEDLGTDLRFAQQQAIAGRKTTGWCTGPGESLKGWQLDFGLSTTSYSIAGRCCLDELCSSESTSTAISTTTLTDGVTRSGGSRVEFASLTGAAGTATDMVLTGAFAGVSNQVTVSVAPSGHIAVGDVIPVPS